MADPFVGQQLANFRIDHLVKVGEDTRVYYGWDVMQRRPVAVKLLELTSGKDGRFADLFVRQAREMLSGWWHEHITKVYYTARENGRYYVVTEYVDGLNLKELMTQYRAAGELMPLQDVTRIGWAAAKALDYAHEQGVIHRDVKPANVLLSADNRILLTDFGLAPPILDKICGTPAYIAPEQAQRPTVAEPSADLYSLAVMLYEMVVGRPPFQAETAVELLQQQTSEMPPTPHSLNPHLNRQVDKVLLKALNKTPEKRYPSGAALLQALEDSLGAGSLDVDDTAELPPLPAVVVSADVLPTLSDVPIVDKIAAQLDMEDRQVMRQRLVGQQSRRRGTWGCLLLVVAAAVLLGWGIMAMQSRGVEPTLTPMLVAAATQESQETVTATAVVPPTITSTPIIIVITAELPTATPTLPPTETPLPTNTPAATAIPPSTTPTHTPTPLFSGPLVQFLYNSNSFYMWNPGEEEIRVDAIAFQAVDSNNQTLPNSFRGRDWSRIYSALESQRCVALEVANTTPLLKPEKCDAYNVTITPPRGAATIFWAADSGSGEFIVFWNGQEIGRCPIVAGICELQLP